MDLKKFGGSLLLRGNPREARPISTRRPMHLVLRAESATGERSFLRRGRARRIEDLVHRLGRQMGVRVYRFANAGNHLHLIVRPSSRQAFCAYLRALSGLIARLTLDAERGRASKQVKFWDSRPFTRILEWGKDFKTVCAYVLQNKLEAIGFVPYRSRGARAGPKGLRSEIFG